MFKHIYPVRYIFSSDKKFYRLIYQLTGLYPSCLNIYKIAFTHKSATRNSELNRSVNNERLEFLGDAILASIIADILFTHFPYKREGFLTKLRARIVSREQLNEIALEMGLQFHIVSQNKITGTKNIYGNALEALIGAIYVDKGFDKTKKFIQKKIVDKYIDIAKLSNTDNDYKSKLIEWAQKNKYELVFNDEEIESTENTNQYFTSEVIVEGDKLGFGKGSSKKEAQQHAAKEALISIHCKSNN